MLGEQGGNDACLCISASDAGWCAELHANGSQRWKEQVYSFPDSDSARVGEQIAQAIARFSSEQPQVNVARIMLQVDDPDLHLVDHRFAKVNNFEPRGLKEFGSQQAGGHAVAFGSIPFGESSARELQKRVLSFLPEDKLGSYFFALGKTATALAAVIPGSTAAFSAPRQEGAIFAAFRMHGYFSTLVVANAQSGIIAARQFPFGTLTLAKAYAEEHGVSLAEASEALRIRSRLPPAPAVKGGGLPEYKTASFFALSPVLSQMHDEIAATLEYFRFQRLAGRPSSLTLTFTGVPIAGFESWLAEAITVPVDPVQHAPPAIADETNAGRLNLLEGSRPGLLKLGNQPFEFSGGRFLPMKGAHTDMPTKKPFWSLFFPPWLEKLDLSVGGHQMPFNRDQALLRLAAVGAVALLAIGNFYFVTGPAKQRLVELASLYDNAAEASIAAVRSTSQASEARDQPVLWADNLFTLGQALLPAMKLQRLELVPPTSKTGAGSDAVLTITGALSSSNPATLKSVGGFIDQLSKDKSFSRRFAQLRFTGAGKSEDATRREMTFRVAALSAGAAR
jgi:hypothetical protein